MRAACVRTHPTPRCLRSEPPPPKSPSAAYVLETRATAQHRLRHCTRTQVGDLRWIAAPRLQIVGHGAMRPPPVHARCISCKACECVTTRCVRANVTCHAGLQQLRMHLLRKQSSMTASVGSRQPSHDSAGWRTVTFQSVVVRSCSTKDLPIPAAPPVTKTLVLVIGSDASEVPASLADAVCFNVLAAACA